MKEVVEKIASEMRFSRPDCVEVIDKVRSRYLELDAKGMLVDVLDTQMEFINDVERLCPKGKPYRSGKRNTKR